MSIKKYDVAVGDVIDQLLYIGTSKNATGDFVEMPKLALTVKLKGKLVNSNNPHGPKVPLPKEMDEYATAEISFWPADQVDEERMNALARDLLNLGYTKEEIDPEDFLKPSGVNPVFDLTGKEIYLVAYPRENGSVTWFLKNYGTTASGKSQQDVLKQWKRSSLGATRTAMQNVLSAKSQTEKEEAPLNF